MGHLNYSDEWFIWEQNASPMLLTMALTAGFNDLRRYLGSSLFNSIIIFEPDNNNNYQGRWFYRPNEELILGQKMLDMLLCPTYFSSFTKGICVAEDTLLRKAKEIWRDSNSYSLVEAIEHFDELLQYYYDYYKRGWFSEPVQYYIEHLISTYLKKNFKGLLSINEAMQALFTAEDESFTTAIIRDLYECAKLIDGLLISDKLLYELINATQRDFGFQNRIIDYIFSSGKCSFSPLVDRLKKHSDEYYWKKSNYFAASFVSPESILLELIDECHVSVDGISKYYSDMIAMISESKTERLAVKSEIFLELSQYYKNLVNLSNSIGSKLKDTRKRNIMECNSAFDALLGIVSRETSVGLEDIHMLIPQELRNFVCDPKSYYERFIERRKLFVCLQTDFSLIDELIENINTSTHESILSWQIKPMDELYIAEGSNAEGVLRNLNMRMNFYDTSEEARSDLCGIVIFCSQSDIIVEGVVRIIRNPKSEVLLDGEILVAPTTTPDYFESIHKCRAIITDWGSQTSHAAIISRELKKPCIIGTSFATQILETGQRISIDFRDGKIEIIR